MDKEVDRKGQTERQRERERDTEILYRDTETQIERESDPDGSIQLNLSFFLSLSMCKSAGMHSNCMLQHFQLHTIHDYMVYIYTWYIYIHNIYICIYCIFFGFVFWLLIWSCQRLLAPLPPGRLPALGFSGYHFANGKLDANQPFHFFFFFGGGLSL